MKELIRTSRGKEYSLGLGRIGGENPTTTVRVYRHYGSIDKKEEGVLTKSFGGFMRANTAYFIRSGYLNIQVDLMIRSGALVELDKERYDDTGKKYTLCRMNQKIVRHFSNVSNEKALKVLGYEED